MSCRPLILITRPLHDARDFALELEQAGFETLIEPMLEIVPAPGFQAPDLSGYEGLLITSANALHVLAVQSQERDIPVFTVGENTASAGRQYGYQDIRIAGGNVDSLADMVKGSGPYLHIRGTHVTGDLSAMLSKKGVACDTLVAYEAVKVKSMSAACKTALENDNITAVTFFSKRTAENFMALAEENRLEHHLRTVKALSISENVLECVQPYAWEEAYAAENPGRSAMLELLKDVCML